jgi:hypothetical protein
MGSAKPRLTNPRVEAEVAHQLLRTREAPDVADRCNKTGGDHQIDARDRNQPRDRGVVKRLAGDLPVEGGEILTHSVQFAHVPCDRETLVIGHRLPFEPGAPDPAEQVGMWTRRDQVRVQDRVHLVLDPRPVPDDLIAARNETAFALRHGIRRPDLREISRRIQTGERAGVDLVGLHMRVRDRLHLERVCDHHPRHEGREHARHRHAVACRLDDDLVSRM